MASTRPVTSTAMSSGNNSKDSPFQLVEVPLNLEPILKQRLPLSTNVYNAMRLNRTWQKDQTWFTLHDPSVDDVWIVMTFLRKDFGRVLCISRPPAAGITPFVQNAFSNCEFMEWGESFTFEAIDTTVSSMVTEISIREKGNWTQVHPCYLFAMDQEEAVSLTITPGNYEVKPINNEKGMDFILKTWKYASDGSRDYVEKCLQRSNSAGVYVNGEIAAGVIFEGHGVIGMLYSLSEHRGKGFARLVMHQLMKESAENQLVPGCMVELRNDISKTFQEKIGFKIAAKVDFVIYVKTGF
ncbi:unnamed protein product [Allacma fusca]|uniref:N-acetyltransferase domain-containing protein n=1 Tax=Allacma fusca TaxID=39272 RepID=A0A8J2JWG6_9HEXA|nr:unnamed protein product [Allacma fusca]